MNINIYIYIHLSLSFSLINSHYEQDMVVEHAQNAMGWPFYLRTGWSAHNHPGHMSHLGQDRYSSLRPDGFKLQTACRNGCGSHWLDPYAWHERVATEKLIDNMDSLKATESMDAAYLVGHPKHRKSFGFVCWRVLPSAGTVNREYYD